MGLTPAWTVEGLRDGLIVRAVALVVKANPIRARAAQRSRFGTIQQARKRDLASAAALW